MGKSNLKTQIYYTRKIVEMPKNVEKNQVKTNLETDKNLDIIKETKTENETKDIKQKKNFTIMGLTVWRILAYFIIYSVVGYIIETIFGIVTKGVWESRQSFLYGPFCSIYGLGATIMIMFLHK